MKCREATSNLNSNFFALILPVEILVYIKTEICSFGNPTYYFLLDVVFLKIIQAIVVSEMTYENEFIFVCVLTKSAMLHPLRDIRLTKKCNIVYLKVMFDPQDSRIAFYF